MNVFALLAARVVNRTRTERLEAEVGTLKRALARSIGETRLLQEQIDAAGERPERGHWVPLSEHTRIAHDLTMARFRIIELEEAARAARH